jgi:pimeloyl-ACP methyl ester carboxylesterase
MSTPGARRFWLHRPRGLAALLTPRPADPEHAVDAAMGLFRTLHGTGMPFPEDEMRALLTEAIERSFYPQGFLRQLAAVVASGDRTRALTQVRIPTLVLHGTHDPLIPPAAGAATAAAIPGARFQLVEGMGHGMPPQAWPTLVDAIADHALGSASVR